MLTVAGPGGGRSLASRRRNGSATGSAPGAGQRPGPQLRHRQYQAASADAGTGDPDGDRIAGDLPGTEYGTE